MLFLYGIGVSVGQLMGRSVGVSKIKGVFVAVGSFVHVGKGVYVSVGNGDSVGKAVGGKVFVAIGEGDTTVAGPSSVPLKGCKVMVKVAVVSKGVGGVNCQLKIPRQ